MNGTSGHSLAAAGFLLALAAAGCDAPRTAQPYTTAAALTAPYRVGPSLRVKLDAARGRVWVLGLDQVEVFDAGSNALIGRIPLPPWSVADALCEPDIAFDSRGTAIISHNVEPRLWEIDGKSLELREHAVRLIDGELLDVGFVRLTFASDGALFALDSSGATLWRIDLRSGTGTKVDQARSTRPPAAVC